MSFVPFPIFFLLLIFRTVTSRSSTCSSCCKPTQSYHPLPLEFYLPMALVIFLAILAWVVWFRDASKQWRKDRFDRSHRFNGHLPTGAISYKIKIHTSGPIQFEWDELPPHTLYFNGNKVEMEETEKPETKTQGTVNENGVLDLPSLKLYPTELPGTVLPGFIAEGNEKLWVLLPLEYQEEPETLFPIYHNIFLMLYFVLIILISSICLIIFWKMHSTSFYADFFVYWPGTPWGVLASIVGLIIMFLYANPFGMVYYRLSANHTSNLAAIFMLIMSTCFIFSIIDMITADFMKGESMIDTRENYILDREEIADFCQMDHYGCSVYWSANLTKRTDDCKDSYYYMCISYNAVQGSCANGNNGIYGLFFGQAISQFFLGLCWLCVSLMIKDISLSDRLPSVLCKMNEWNKGGGGEPTEKKTELERTFKEESRLLGDTYRT